MSSLRVETLRQFHDAMASTVPARRVLTRTAMNSVPHDGGAVALLADVLGALETIPEDEGGHYLHRTAGTRLAVDLTYEIRELRRDLAYLEGGQTLLWETLCCDEEFSRQVEAAVTSIGDCDYRTFLTDRDGTVNNYCGRYASSVQSIYNAVFLAEFTQAKAQASVLLTSAPLSNVGIADLCVMPPGTFIMAGSKGRECIDSSGRLNRFPIDTAKKASLDQLNRGLDRLLAQRDYEIFSLIGSGCQHKFGQTTVAYQDITGSVDTEISDSFRADVRHLVNAIDDNHQLFRIEDTGLDLELILTVDAGPAGGVRDFDKGDGLRFLDRCLNLGLGNGKALVCGDTASDVTMMAAAAQMAPTTKCVLVSEDPELIAVAEQQFPGVHVAASPDVLVAALHQCAQQ